jgi:hypothetical protein
MVLQYGLTGWRFLMREVPLHCWKQRRMVHPDSVKPPQLSRVPPPYRGTSLIRNRHPPTAPP